MDFAEMGARLGLEKDEFMELVLIFISSAEEDLCKFRNALGQNNARAVAEASHSLKGSSGNLGFAEISKIAAMVENKAREGELEELEPMAASIEKEIENLKTFL